MALRRAVWGLLSVPFLLVANAGAGTIAVTQTGAATSGTCTLGQAIYAANRANNPADATPVGATTVAPLSASSTTTAGIGACVGATAGPNVIVLPSAATISFSTDAPDNFWYGPNALPPIASAILIQGNASTLQVVAGSSPRLRFFFVGADPQSDATPGYNTPGPGRLTLQNLTLRGGRQLGGSVSRGGGGAGMGGAIYNQGTTTLTAVTVVDNQAQGGIGSAGANRGGGGMGGDPGAERGGSMGGAVPLGTADAGHDADPVYGFGADGGGTPNGTGGTNGASGTSGIGGNGSGAGGYGSNPGGIGGGGGGGGGFGGGPGGLGSGTWSGGGRSGGDGGSFGSGGVTGNVQSTGGGGGGGVGAGGGSGNSTFTGNGGFGGGYGTGVSTAGASGGFGGGGANPGGYGGFGGGAAYGAAGGAGGSGAGFGGAIFNHAGTLLLLNSTLSGNHAIGGPNAYSGGASGCGGSGFGGAIFNLGGSVGIAFSTLAANTVVAGNSNMCNGNAGGGAIYSLAYNGAASTGSVSAKLTLENSILSNSVGGSDLTVDQPAQVAGGLANVAVETVTVLGRNLVMSATALNSAPNPPAFPLTSNPQLLPLAMNGGGAMTMALDAGSPAIGAALFADAQPPNDQRGYARQSGPAPDLGAFEYGASPVTKATPTLAITGTAPNPSPLGQGYTVTFSLLGGQAPAGIVSVFDGSSGCAAELPATGCTLLATTVGTKTLTGTYMGDLANNSATATRQHTVGMASPSLSISTTPSPTVVGQPYAVTATLNGGYSPSGTIAVSDGAANCTITLPAMSCGLASSTSGAKTLTAAYSGDGNHNAAGATASHPVEPAATTTTISAPATVSSGASFDISVSVSPAAPGAGTPTGSVDVRIAGQVVCTANLSAGALCTASSNLSGTQVIDGVYLGDANFSGSTSAASTIEMSPDCSANDITLTEQAEVDAFQSTYGPCRRVRGTLAVSGSNIVNLTGLADLIEVGGDLVIDGNASLQSLDGLVNFASSAYQVRIENNPALTRLDFSALTHVGTDLSIINNAALQSLHGLEGLTATANRLTITDNATLKSLAGLGGMRAVGTVLTVTNNPSLAACSAIIPLVDAVDDAQPGPGPGAGGVPDVGAEVEIGGNLFGCNAIPQILLPDALFANGFENP